MGTPPNIIERAYKTLNSATKLTISVDEWLSLLAVALALGMPELTGTPPKYASPVTLFVALSAIMFIRRRAAWLKTTAINAAGCFILYVVLAVFGSKQ